MTWFVFELEIKKVRVAQLMRRRKCVFVGRFALEEEPKCTPDEVKIADDVVVRRGSPSKTSGRSLRWSCTARAILVGARRELCVLMADLLPKPLSPFDPPLIVPWYTFLLTL